MPPDIMNLVFLYFYIEDALMDADNNGLKANGVGKTISYIA
jgi:hypothetical protein